MKSSLQKQAVVIFIALALVFAVLMVAAQTIADPFGQTLMVSVGSAIFGAGLTFFLIQYSRPDPA